ncbi:MAG: hypothetical protein M3Y56_04020 [Armatimonadota bacterium]|nr:hypothetical protein [Armatimonadota bacterium]
MKRVPNLAAASVLLLLTALAHPAEALDTKAGATPPAPTVWISPPGMDNGRCLRELFEHPDGWKETRSLVDVLFYTDLNFNKQFKDADLALWFPQLKAWNIKLALEVGAIKEWGPTGEKTFNAERPMWDRIQRLGGDIYAIALDEPLLCVRNSLKKPDAYAVEETANYIALVRQNYPKILIGDIETYPSIPYADHLWWIDAIQKRLAEKNVRGLDFYRLDVNWAEFNVFDRGTWPEVKKLETFCRQRGLPFSLIYWPSDYPGLKAKKLADDSTWYVSIMRQGNDYAFIGGAPDQYVIESWIAAPSRSLPETGDFTFTRSVRDFARKFVPKKVIP